MLSPQYLEQLPEPLIALWQQVEDDILRDIARRIQKMGTITETAAYQAWRLEQTKLLHTDIVKLISKYSGKSETAIRKMLVEAGTQTLRTEDAIHAAAGVTLPEPNKSQNLQNLLNAGYRQTAGTWKNLTATTANTVSRQFEDALDRAWLQVSSGAFDYQTAIRRAIHNLAEHMDGVTYPSGHRDSLEVAVRRATLTGVNQTCGKLQLERAQEAGCEFVEVTAHVGARDTGSGPANHASWQGKVYHVGGPIYYEGEYYKGFEETTGYGTGPGLCGWNCRHNFFSFWPGISSRVYTDKQLQAICAKDIEYKGKKYSRYEINQMQRAKERQVRKWKKTYLMEKEAGLDTTQSALRLKEARKALSDFAEATGGRVDSNRTAVNNFGHSPASKAAWEARKAGFSQPVAAQKSMSVVESEQAVLVKPKDIPIPSDTVIYQDEPIKPQEENIVRSNPSVHPVTKLDIEKYKCVSENITTDEVVITDERIQHIKDRHPNDYERYEKYLSQIIESPDYILQANKPNTAFLLKHIAEGDESFELILRLAVNGDPAGYKNSVITFLKIENKRYKRYLRTKKILYKSE